jgi:hypothetical protein
MKTKLIVTLLTVLALTGLTAGTSATAAPAKGRAPAATLAASQLLGVFVIHSRADYNQCLDADLNTIGGNGTRVQMWTCNGQRQQMWLIHDVDGYRVFQNAYSLRVLEGVGTSAYLWQFDNSNYQKWVQWWDSLGVGWGFYSSVAPNRSLDANPLQMWRDGATVRLADYGWGVQNQVWDLVQIA